MPRGIIIFGSSGSGKTTLGRLVAQRLSFPYFDLDDYIWRRDTAVPFTVMYSRQEKAERLMRDLSPHAHFVMAGSMDSFHAPFDPFFDLAVHLDAPASLRLARIHARESALFGARIEEGGDMYEAHQRFLASSARYGEDDVSPCRKTHLAWAQTLPCPVLMLDGSDPPEHNADRILQSLPNFPDKKQIDRAPE